MILEYTEENDCDGGGKEVGQEVQTLQIHDNTKAKQQQYT